MLNLFSLAWKFRSAIVIVIIIAAVAGLAYYVNHAIEENKDLKVQMISKDGEIETLKNNFNVLSDSVRNQNIEVNQLRADMVAADVEAKKATEIFVKHNLTQLSAAKPGLIEERVRVATEKVFSGMQQDTEVFYKKVTNE